MNDDKYITTKEGLEELKRELEERKTKTRDKIADEIARARDQGDLSENAAYTSALETKQFNEARITELEDIIANAVIKTANPNDKKLGLGETVILERVGDSVEFEYQIVGENETDPLQKKISLKSPIGAAVFGKKIGDEVEIELPSGRTKFKIKKIH